MPKLIAQKPATTFANAQAKLNEYHVSDGHGLSLLVKPNGSKIWVFRYRYAKKSDKLTIGRYQDFTLKSAREMAQEFRQNLDRGDNPRLLREQKERAESQVAKERKEVSTRKEETFRVIAEEHYNIMLVNLAGETKKHIRAWYENDIYPTFGDTAISEINQRDVRVCIQKIHAEGKQDKAHRVLWRIKEVCKYAEDTGRLENNVVGRIQKVIPPTRSKHRAALTRVEDFTILMNRINNYQGWYAVKGGLKLLALMFCRPGEIRNAKWSEIDFNSALWDVPAERMKMRRSHLVPLSRQVMEILNWLREDRPTSEFILPSPRDKKKQLSNTTFSAALIDMGFPREQMCPHGFRAIAQTNLEERGKNHEVIEFQLSHAKPGLGETYNRARYLEQRKELMQYWADFVDSLLESRKAQI